jgi:hypothetical protein
VAVAAIPRQSFSVKKGAYLLAKNQAWVDVAGKDAVLRDDRLH